MARAFPFLTFETPRGQSAAEAMAFYVDLFPGGSVVSERRRPEGGPGAGSVEVAEFVRAGQTFRCSDSFVEHGWDFTPAMSVWFDCDSTDDLPRPCAALEEGGRVFMPLDDYGFGPFAWVQDRFGVSWQLAGPAGSA